MMVAAPGENQQLVDFWQIAPEDRPATLLKAIEEVHAWHFPRNQAYQRIVSGRSVGLTLQGAPDLPLILRPTAQTFKSYIEILGSPFPNDHPQEFLNWLADQLSVELPRQQFTQFRRRYGSLEAFLKEIETRFSSFGLEILTSSGTSGRSTIMARDQDSIAKTVESFYLAFQRYLGMRADHRAIFLMPLYSRIAMARMASFSVRRVGLPAERVHYTIPFAAYPDQVRIRAGRTYRDDWRGVIEARLLNPFMNNAFEKRVTPRMVRSTLQLLELSQSQGDKVLLFGGWSQLHAIALQILERGQALRLAPGSLLGAGGGFKERYPFSMDQIRSDLQTAIQLTDGQTTPVRDVYGMAEGNWAAMQCAAGNYHIPPWIFAVTLDEDDSFQAQSDSTGMLAFYDPIGGGRLFPSFFKTADRIRLINGSLAYDPAMTCPCGDPGAYIIQGSIQRVDLIDEAGCAAQV